MLQRLAAAGQVKGKTVGVDATTLEANAALRSIVRRDSGESYQDFLTKLAQASGIETPTRADLARSIGVGTPRGLQGRLSAILATLLTLIRMLSEPLMRHGGPDRRFHFSGAAPWRETRSRTFARETQLSPRAVGPRSVTKEMDKGLRTEAGRSTKNYGPRTSRSLYLPCFSSSNSGTNAPPGPPRPGARL
jgi:hypothetical protein